MGVYIEGMEMPKGRPVCIVIDAVGQARRYDLNNDRYADKELFEAVPVPPHGRLIDADARVNVQMYNDEFEDYQTVNMSIDDLLDSSWIELEGAPTIIPAEEEKS